MKTNLLKNRRQGRLAAVLGGAVLLVVAVGVAAPANAATTVVAGPTADSSATYLLDVNGQQATLTEGETVVFPMQRIIRPGEFSTDAVYPGTVGTITVTASGGVYHWDVAMSIPATSFAGAFYVTDLTSGLSGGATPALAFSGDAPTSRLYNHRYSGTLTGQAFFLGVAVSTTGPNNTLYTYR